MKALEAHRAVGNWRGAETAGGTSPVYSCAFNFLPEDNGRLGGRSSGEPYTQDTKQNNDLSAAFLAVRDQKMQ